MNRNEHIEMPQLLTQLYHKSSDIIIFINKDGKVIGMNPAAQNMVDPGDFEKGLPYSLCKVCQGYTSSTDDRTCVNCFLQETKQDFSSFQMFLKTKTGETMPFTASYNVIDEDAGVRVLMLKNLTSQIKTQEELYENKMTHHIIKAQEDERKRISRELHDSVTQELLNSLVELRLIKYMGNEGDKLSKVKQTEMTLTRLLDDVRNLSVELRPSSLDDLGLVAAFRSHFKWIEKNYGLVVYFQPELGSSRYESEVETVVYRVCQESVFNALKYAQVDEVTVQLFEKNEELHLIVTDNGIGFDLLAEAKGTGLGLYGMRERAEFVHGQCTIFSELNKGTTVHLTVPLDSGIARS